MALKAYVYALMTDRRQDAVARILQFFLWILCVTYGAIVWMTYRLYQLRILPSYRSPKPVISIGNITVGGAGKTPLVITVVRALGARGLRAAVLTRGYMPESHGDKFSDEARMLEECLPGVPVMVGTNRRVSIQECLKHHAVDVFVCDDAFSHWPLQRDLDVVAVDSVNPFGNGCLLPRGILREAPGVLSRAHVLVLTKVDQAPALVETLRARLKLINPSALVVEAWHAGVGCVEVFRKSAYGITSLKGVPVVAFCGVADPNSFKQSLIQAGLNLTKLFVFMDHHVYSDQDMASVRRYALDTHARVIMTTHKDAVKIRKFEKFWEGFQVYYLLVEMEISHGKNIFIERIVSACRR